MISEHSSRYARRCAVDGEVAVAVVDERPGEVVVRVPEVFDGNVMRSGGEADYARDERAWVI
jgi:hypothetical protein